MDSVKIPDTFNDYFLDCQSTLNFIKLACFMFIY
jgi:hypothetical protein